MLDASKRVSGFGFLGFLLPPAFQLEGTWSSLAMYVTVLL